MSAEGFQNFCMPFWEENQNKFSAFFHEITYFLRKFFQQPSSGS
jgi:hypothetical protein